jgi:2-haloacid dehalogenase
VLALGEAGAEHFRRVWRRLEPLPEAAVGLARPRRRWLVATLSNGKVLLLTELVKNAGLPFDGILSAKLFRC